MESTPAPRQQRLGVLRQKLTTLAAEVAQIEDEIAELESDAVLKLEAPRATQATPKTPADKVALFLDLFGTRRSVYLERIEHALANRIPNVPRYRLDGLLGKKARKEVMRQINEHYVASTPFVLFATASLVGEGFDLPQLDTLVLAMPLSFKGRLVQYVGRLHRSHNAKRDVLIFDYLDENHAITNAMFRRRVVGYRELGYFVEMPGDATPMAW